MSPLIAMWIASILGALLFFIAGFLAAGRGPREPRTVDDALPKEPVISEAEQLVTRLTNERGALKTVVTELESQLKSRVAASEQLEIRISELETELASRPNQDEFDSELTRVRAATGTGLLEELMAESTASATAERDADVVATLLQILERHVAEDESWRAATLADDLGMPVVGAGENKEALAVFAGLIEHMETRTRALVPIKELRRLTVEDTDGVVVSSCTLPNKSLSLVTVTHHETPSTEAMTELLEHTARML